MASTIFNQSFAYFLLVARIAGLSLHLVSGCDIVCYPTEYIHPACTCHPCSEIADKCRIRDEAADTNAYYPNGCDNIKAQGQCPHLFPTALNTSAKNSGATVDRGVKQTIQDGGLASFTTSSDTSGSGSPARTIIPVVAVAVLALVTVGAYILYRRRQARQRRPVDPSGEASERVNSPGHTPPLAMYVIQEQVPMIGREAESSTSNIQAVHRVSSSTDSPADTEPSASGVTATSNPVVCAPTASGQNVEPILPNLAESTNYPVELPDNPPNLDAPNVPDVV